MSKKEVTVLGTTPVFMSEEEKIAAFKASKNAAAKRMLARKAEAMEKLIAMALRIGTDEEKKAAMYLLPHPVGPRTVSPVDSIREAPMTEDEVWMKFKLGRTEMKRVLKANPTMTFIDGVYSL